MKTLEPEEIAALKNLALEHKNDLERQLKKQLENGLNFVRERPLTSLAAAFVTGFVAARMLRGRGHSKKRDK